MKELQRSESNVVFQHMPKLPVHAQKEMFGFDCKVSLGWPTKHKNNSKLLVVSNTSDGGHLNIYECNTEVLALYKDYFSWHFMYLH